MKDELGDRMKSNYEDRTRYSLPRRTYTILRLDGKAFHTYTRGLNKPFDNDLSEDIDGAIIDRLPHIQGAKFAYTQSDEISILVTDFGLPGTSAWFDGNLQKMVSVSSSILTAHFNSRRQIRGISKLKNEGIGGVGNFIEHAYFDCRAFTIPDKIEVMNYFRWRQQDCCRNSMSMVAQSKFSHKELQGKSQSQMHDMLHNIGVNWATDYSDGHKNGRMIIKEEYTIKNRIDNSDITRSRWASKGAWVFSKDEGKLLDMIPKYE
jgi:tRNA(His) guanylyltransferase